MKRKKLIKTIAFICHVATEHTSGWEEDNPGDVNFVQLFQCTSYTVACLLAQNTRLGVDGVEADIVLDELCQRPVKSMKEWKKIATRYVDILNDSEDEFEEPPSWLITLIKNGARNA